MSSTAPAPEPDDGLDVFVCGKPVFPWVASRANMLYLAARTHSRAAVCLPAAHIAALREFWADCKWLPTLRINVQVDVCRFEY